MVAFAQVIIRGIGKQENGTVGHTDSRDGSKPRLSSAVLSKKDDHYHDEHGPQIEASQQRHSSRKHEEYAGSENDRQQQNSRSGCSKSEHWTSHKEMESSTNAKSPTSSYMDRKIERSSEKSLPSRHQDELSKRSGDFGIQNPSGGAEIVGDLESKDVDLVAKLENQHVDPERIGDERHLSTVQKLKKRSERFKLPMPSEKETSVNRKLERKETSLTQSETTVADAEIKQERPPRKRRWSELNYNVRSELQWLSRYHGCS